MSRHGVMVLGHHLLLPSAPVGHSDHDEGPAFQDPDAGRSAANAIVAVEKRHAAYLLHGALALVEDIPPWPSHFLSSGGITVRPVNRCSSVSG